MIKQEIFCLHKPYILLRKEFNRILNSRNQYPRVKYRGSAYIPLLKHALYYLTPKSVLIFLSIYIYRKWIPLTYSVCDIVLYIKKGRNRKREMQINFDCEINIILPLLYHLMYTQEGYLGSYNFSGFLLA